MDASPTDTKQREGGVQSGDSVRATAGTADAPVLACRRMTEPDIAAVTDLLCEGFPERSRAYWLRALDRMSRRSVPEGMPRFGYVMTDGGRPVGIILVLASDGPEGRRGNLSSWYVRSDYRGFSHMLLSIPLRLKETVLVNISPALSTLDTIAAQGFREYSQGTFQALAALGRPVFGARVRPAIKDYDDRLLAEHLSWGCLTLEVEHEGILHPFVFTRSWFLGGRLPCAQLVYSRSIEDVVRFAGPLGRHLLRRGFLAVTIDARGPIAGLPGLFRRSRGHRFYRGARPPRLGDLSYTELAMFGP